jgi:hypothetical protein
VEQGFATRDFLQAHQRDADLLGARLHIAPGVRLEYKARWQSGAWQPDSMRLCVDGGIPARVGLDANVRSLIERLARFDDLAAAIEDFAGQLGMPARDVQGECLRILRRLLEQCCLIPG